MKKHQNHNEKVELSEKVAFLAPIAAIFMHTFCCGIPLALAVLSGVFGVAVNIPFIEKSETSEIFVFVFSAILLGISYVLYFRSKDCCHTHKKRKFYNKIILIAATALFAISAIIHLIGYY
ncbi:MAG: hypothetical protein LBR70_01555 [Lactobacillaceae bacterium]|jgi:uncharacterized membrane protein YidH (DUF202 family)|nr:hypothetical protein [Lactobacillaceae bacterium]